MAALADAGIRDILLKLAQQIFPLEKWMQDPAKYVPPEVSHLPWRADGQRLSLQSMRAIDRLELLIDAYPSDESLRVRWGKVAAAPRWLEQSLPYPIDWRAQRKLEDVAVFAPADSDNVMVAAVDPKTKLRTTHARPEFYAACWPLLRAAQVECLFPDDASWNDFAKSLFNDLLSAWPPTAPVKSSDFIKQLAKDLAICLLDMENPLFAATDEGDLWQRAVLIEAGEHRHRHNAFDVKQAEAAVEEMRKKLSALL